MSLAWSEIVVTLEQLGSRSAAGRPDLHARVMRSLSRDGTPPAMSRLRQLPPVLPEAADGTVTPTSRQCLFRTHVVDAATGGPVPGARVMLKGGTHSDPGVATDAMGIADLDRREPGRLDLQVWARGYERFRMPVDAVSGMTQDLGTIRLAKEVTVEGRVIDNEGYPLAASFCLGRLEPSGRSIQWFEHEVFESSATGTFSIPGLGRGEYVIRTRDDIDRGEWLGPPWVSGNQRLDTRAGSISGLEIRLVQAAKLVLRLARTNAGKLRFAVDDESGLQLVDGALGPEPRPLDLPSGSYRVCLLDARGTVLSERSVTLGSEPTLLDLAR